MKFDEIKKAFENATEPLHASIQILADNKLLKFDGKIIDVSKDALTIEKNGWPRIFSGSFCKDALIVVSKHRERDRVKPVRPETVAKQQKGTTC